MRLGKRGWIIIISALVAITIVLSVALYLYFVPLDLTRYSGRIESAIESRTGRRVNLDRIILKALPSPDLNLKGIRVYEDGSPLLISRSAHIRMSLWPLFTGKAVLQTVDMEGAELFIKRYQNGKLNIVEFLARKPKKKTKSVIESLNLRDGRIKFTDEMVPGAAVLDVADAGGYIYRTGAGYTYKFTGRLLPDTLLQFSGNTPGDGKVITGSGQVRSADLSMLSPYMGKALPGASLSGKAEIDSNYQFTRAEQSVSGIISYSKLKTEIPRFFEKNLVSPSGSAKVDLVFKKPEFELSIKDLRLEMEDFRVKGGMSLKGPRDNKRITLTLSTDSVPFQSARSLIPVKKLPNKTAVMVRKVTPLGGGITVKDFALNGNINDLKSAGVLSRDETLRLSLAMNNLSFRYKGFKEPFSGLTGKLELKDRVLTLLGITGRYGEEVLENLEGKVTGLPKKPVYDVIAKGRADAGETLQLANDLITDEALKDKISKATAAGKVAVDIKVKGSFKSASPVVYSGSASISGGSFAYEGVPVAFESINGGASFDNTRIELKGVSASNGRSTIAVDGTIEDYRKGSPLFNLKAQGNIAQETVGPIVKSKTGRDISFSGLAGFRMEAMGRPKAFAGDLFVDMAATDLSITKIMEKEKGLPLSISASGGYSNDEVEIKKAVADFGESYISLSGKASLKARAYNFLASSKQLRVADLDNISPFLIKDYESDGLMSFDINSSKASKETPTVITGNAQVRDGRFKTSFLPNPVENITASVEFNGNRAKVRVENLVTGKTVLKGDADITDIAGRRIDFRVFSPFLRTEDFITGKKVPEKAAQTKELAEEKALERLEAPKAPPITGRGRIEVAEGSAWGHPFTDFRTEAVLGKDKVEVSPLSFNVDKGHLSGVFRYYKDPATPDLFECELNAADIDLETMIEGFGAKRKVLSGDLQGHARIVEKRGAEPPSSGLNGNVSLRSEKGKLWKFPLLTSIFALVNIFSIDELLKQGMPYKDIEGEFKVENGIISTDKFRLDSDSMKMSAVGSINIPEAAIDSTIALHPFVTIDKIISNIPLAGWIITGKEKSTISMYFGVEGPLKDPDVEPKPIATIEKDIFGVLERLLEAPLGIFKREEERKDRK